MKMEWRGAGLIVALAGALAGETALAQTYPVKPVRIVVPVPPGGGIDFMARLAGQSLGERMGQQFIVDNRPGAGGAIGTALAARAAPDGYTLLLGFVGQIAMLPHAEKVAYDPLRDFTPVSLLASSYHVMAVHPSLPVRSVKQLIAFAKARPGELNYAAGNIWSPAHLAPELFKMVTGINVVAVFYKGSAPAAVGVLTGEAHMLFGSITSVVPHLRTNRLAALAVTSPARSPLVPEVPTLMESGVRGAEVPLWYALLAPAATPRDVIMKLHGELAKAAAGRGYRDQLDKQTLEAQTGTPEQAAEFMRAEYEKWAKVIKKIKAR